MGFSRTLLLTLVEEQLQLVHLGKQALNVLMTKHQSIYMIWKGAVASLSARATILARTTVLDMSLGWFNPTTPWPLNSRGNKDHRIISHEFGVVHLFWTGLNCSKTRGTREFGVVLRDSSWQNPFTTHNAHFIISGCQRIPLEFELGAALSCWCQKMWAKESGGTALKPQNSVTLHSS